MTTQEPSKNHNTNYYRRNKIQRFNVKSCVLCNYETTGPKSALQAHIWAKHTPENERPFQCPCNTCKRGFSARANLNKHILKKHKIVMPKKIDKNVLMYKISLQKEKTETQSDNECIQFYKKHPYIVADQLPFDNNNKTISFVSLYYDKGRGLINITPMTRRFIKTTL